MANHKQAVISQDQLWDDSALVDSWNAAFEEYKKYHSLAAQGLKVDLSTSHGDSDLLSTPQQQQRQQHQQHQFPATTAQDASAAESDEYAPPNFIAAEAASTTAPALTSDVPHSDPFRPEPPPAQPQIPRAAVPDLGSASSAAMGGLVGLPQVLLGNTQDETLKGVMMSWYYAGYYTGLLEGQQKAYAAMQESE